MRCVDFSLWRIKGDIISLSVKMQTVSIRHERMPDRSGFYDIRKILSRGNIFSEISSI